MTTPPPPTAGPPARGRGRFGRWAATHKTEAATGAGVGLVLLVVLYKKIKGSSTAANTAATTTGTTPAGTAGYVDPSGDYNSLEAQLAALQSQMAAQTTAPAGSTPAPGPATTPPPASGGAPPHALNAGSYGGPNLLGDTWAQVQAALSGSPFHVNTKSGNVSGGKVVSFTPYSDNSINLGFS